MEEKKGFIGEIITIGIFVCLFIILIGFYTQQIKIKGKLTCNSGFVGLDLESYNTIQNKTCEFDRNYTCFKEDMQIKHFKIKNIENLNCNMEYEGDIPSGIFSIMGGLQ